jgi:polysaccharide export outer membrane protein
MVFSAIAPRVLSVALVLAAGVCAQSQDFASRTPRYRIQTSDVLEIQFRFTPEFNQTVTVQPDGFVSLQATKEVKLQDLTIDEAVAAVSAQYKGILHEPAITILLKEFNKPYFVVGGEVAHPGKFELRGPITLTDAIAMAGGFTQNAKHDQLLLFRRVSPETAEVKKMSLKQVLGKGNLIEDVRLQPGDGVYVSKSTLGKIDRFMAVTRLGVFFPIPGLR